MTSCVHKMWEPTYGQTNMKRAITLAKINHPWNRYNMRMLRSWPIKIPNMNKIRQMTNDYVRSYILCTQLVICLLSHFIHIWYLDWPWSAHAHIREIAIICACWDHGQSRYQIWIKYDKWQMTSCVHKMWERTFGQTNMKKAITLAKINQDGWFLREL
jgi:hypothetical protein